MNPSVEDLKSSEEARISVVQDRLKEWSDLHEKMNTDYLGHLASYYRERREMFKYIGTVAGGAAALAPQVIDRVQQMQFFYLGVGLLCLVVVIAVTHVISSVEEDAGKLSKDLRNKNDLIDRLRKPKVDFLLGTDYGVEAFAAAMAGGVEEIDGLKAEAETNKVKRDWFVPMDYTGEFIIWFFFGGLTLLALSLSNYQVTWLNLVWASLIVLLAINILSTFPRKIFQLLGAPIDLVKSGLRWIFKK